MADTDVITLGCRLNAAEAEAMRAHAAAAGVSDTVIVNTCAVTAEAVRQAEQTIRRVRRERPGARVVVTGCAAQIEPERFAAMAEVDQIVGNDEKMQPETYRQLGGGEFARIAVNDIQSVSTTAGHLIDGFGGRRRAYVQVQNGCDHRCTFCIIPYGRGRSRSVPAGEVVARIRRLVEAGAQEVVLTGVDITAYGADLPGGATLGKLARQILKLVPELPRLRLSSIDQSETDPVLLEVIAEEPRLMPHLHLSLQAGDDLVLKRMKRRHLREDALRFCREVRAVRPDVAFGADLIAGFPTETEEMFQRSLDLVDECGLAYLHVFPYSPRRGTPAARMPQVPRQTIKARAARLRTKGEDALRHHLDRAMGKIVVALVEDRLKARAPDYAEIHLDREAAGDLVEARIVGHNGRRLEAVVLNPAAQ
jgi:threonylcarbamoyladenosine tRNA methylthiotransferase MtaB